METRIPALSAKLARGSAPAASGLALCLGIVAQPAFAQTPNELLQPLVCSAATVSQPEISDICSVADIAGGGKKVKVSLTAQTSEIQVGGYKVTTENYNGNYLTPVVEAMPGDTVAAHLVNRLAPRDHGHGEAADNPTNLHYFHGGIVTPNNARPKKAEEGNGDNVYVHLKSGTDEHGNPNSFDFEVPIPGEGKLDARVLEETGFIPHPLGLNWYHSHLHGFSSAQVMGGMSGLLSVGEADANVQAACVKDPADETRCLNDVESDTTELKDRTEVRYGLLRDISLKLDEGSALPGVADGAPATWDPDNQDFSVGRPCGVWKDGAIDSDAKLRLGFCQRDQDTARLFTINGQRYPTITVEGGKNLLLRLGNLSSNVPYWLELSTETGETVLNSTLLSLDGVVPTKLVPAGEAKLPVQASEVPNLLLMPASRAEIYIRNDTILHSETQVYVLKTKGFQAFQEVWPEIRLARIELRPNALTSEIAVALNAYAVTPPLPSAAAAGPTTPEAIKAPDGCVRDLNPDFKEYRRVTFRGVTPPTETTQWDMITEIIRPQTNGGESSHKSVDEILADEILAGTEKPTTVGPIAFDAYTDENGLVDWSKDHTCIYIDGNENKGSHKQLWVLNNATLTLHNFHIHQMKFRLATADELRHYHITTLPAPNTCPAPPASCSTPDYNLYETLPADKKTPLWHDTIPMPPLSRVYVIMSFDAEEQIGRFVYHCHILKHEDKGLMAPIEVWGAAAATQ